MRASQISAVMRALARRRWAKPGATATGRPRGADRCPCGQFTKHTAALRKHVCQATALSKFINS